MKNVHIYIISVRKAQNQFKYQVTVFTMVKGAIYENNVDLVL